MRKILFRVISLSICLTVGLTQAGLTQTDTKSCPDGEDMTWNELHSKIQSYISINHPGAEVDDVERYVADGVTTYRIELDGSEDTELVFDVNGNLLGSFMEDDTDHTALPAVAMDKINAAFQGIKVDGLNMEMSWRGNPVYEVELSNGVEVLLDMEGNMVCKEN